jgi:Amiloride-sensitive sodium channel
MPNLNKFAQANLIHGFKYIFGSNHGKITRIFWILSLLVSSCGFIYYLRPAWNKLLFEPEILIKTRERKVEEFPKPAITICPNVFARDLNINYYLFST